MGERTPNASVRRTHTRSVSAICDDIVGFRKIPAAAPTIITCFAPEALEVPGIQKTHAEVSRGFCTTPRVSALRPPSPSERGRRFCWDVRAGRHEAAIRVRLSSVSRRDLVRFGWEWAQGGQPGEPGCWGDWFHEMPPE